MFYIPINKIQQFVNVCIFIALYTNNSLREEIYESERIAIEKNGKSTDEDSENYYEPILFVLFELAHKSASLMSKDLSDVFHAIIIREQDEMIEKSIDQFLVGFNPVALSNR